MTDENGFPSCLRMKELLSAKNLKQKVRDQKSVEAYKRAFFNDNYLCALLSGRYSGARPECPAPIIMTSAFFAWGEQADSVGTIEDEAKVVSARKRLRLSIGKNIVLN